MRFQPRYREAFPRLNIVEAKAATEQRGADLCRFIDERGRCVGDASIHDFDGNMLHLRMHIAGPYIESTRAIVPMPVVPAPNGVDKDRVFFRCRGCKGRFAILVFKDAWGCAKCHKLLYRQQLLTPGVIKYERMIALQDQIGRGKPHGMRQSTFQPVKAELEDLEATLKGRLPEWASEEHSYRIDAHWVEAKDFAGDIWSDWGIDGDYST